MQTYLSKDKIKAIANYLNTAIPKQTAKILIELESKGVELIYSTGSYTHRENQLTLWKFIENEWRKQATPNDFGEYKRMLDMGWFEQCGNNFIVPYIDKHYKKEYDTICNTDLSEINNKLNYIGAVKTEAHLNQHIDLKEIVFSGDYEQYLTEHFGEKNIDPELLKITNRIADYIDSQYHGKRGEKEYIRYQYAIKQYMQTGDKQLLHNLLNED
jgi:hypothetical protein